MSIFDHPQGAVLDVDSGDLRYRRLRRSIATNGRLLDDLLPQVDGRADRWAMVTCTYRDDVQWEPRQITRLLKCIRRHVQAAGFVFRYVWVLEMTKRGRPHYHVAIKLPAGLKLPKPDQVGWWEHGMTRIEFARHVVAYLLKYLSKLDCLAHYPKGSRVSGFGGLTPEAKRERRFWASPSYVREEFGEDSNPFRAPGGGWINRETGEIIPSRYKLIARSGKRVRLLDLWHSGRPPTTSSMARKAPWWRGQQSVPRAALH